jgi:hypothetical protein
MHFKRQFIAIEEDLGYNPLFIPLQKILLILFDEIPLRNLKHTERNKVKTRTHIDDFHLSCKVILE